MEKIVTFLITILFLIGCGTILNVTYFYPETTYPERKIDSLSNVNDIPIPSYKDWNKAQYFTNDSVIISTYTYVTEKNDTTYIFTLIEEGKEYVLKYRKEWRTKK